MKKIITLLTIIAILASPTASFANEDVTPKEAAEETKEETEEVTKEVKEEVEEVKEETAEAVEETSETAQEKPKAEPKSEAKVEKESTVKETNNYSQNNGSTSAYKKETTYYDQEPGFKLRYPLSEEGMLTSPFGYRPPEATNGIGTTDHKGIDIAIASGTPIVAAENGKVTKAYWWGGYGNMVEVTHEGGMVTRYGHMLEINVSVGDEVIRGQQIGRVGSTGNSTGPHLHFEVLIDDVNVDPLLHLNEKERLKRTPMERNAEDIGVDLIILIEETEKGNEIYDFLFGFEPYVKKFILNNEGSRISVVYTGTPDKNASKKAVLNPWIDKESLLEATSHVLYKSEKEALEILNINKSDNPEIVLKITKDGFSTKIISGNDIISQEKILWNIAKDFSEIV